MSYLGIYSMSRFDGLKMRLKAPTLRAVYGSDQTRRALFGGSGRDRTPKAGQGSPVFKTGSVAIHRIALPCSGARMDAA